MEGIVASGYYTGRGGAGRLPGGEGDGLVGGFGVFHLKKNEGEENSLGTRR